MIAPLEGSKITVQYESGAQKIVIPQPSGGLLRYLTAAFVLFWLGGWAIGWISAAMMIFAGPGFSDLFILFWLGAWTVGGFLAIWMLFRMIRPSVPETITLSHSGMHYDSGIEPFQFAFGYRSQREMWKKLFKKRARVELNHSELQTLRLREFENGNRLTVDQGSNRLEIATAASELEREWLFALLREHYNLGGTDRSW